MLAIVFGIQGVGKSTVVNMVMDKFADGEWTLLAWGEAAFDVCIQKGHIRVGDYSELHNGKLKSEDAEHGIAIVELGKEEVIFVKDQTNLKLAKDEIRNLNIYTQIKIQKEVANHFKALLAEDKVGNYLIETHAALKTKQGYLPGLPKSFLQSTEPDVYIIIEADVDEIFVRRLLDKKRKRDHDKTTKDVQTNIDTTRYFASAFAVVTHAPLVIVENKEKRSQEAADEIAEVLNRFQ